MWNLGTNLEFALGPRNQENLDRVGWSQELPDANRLLASSLASNPRALTLVPIYAVVFLLFCFLFFLTIIVMCI
jgi:hypothetical protein